MYHNIKYHKNNSPSIVNLLVFSPFLRYTILPGKLKNTITQFCHFKEQLFLRDIVLTAFLL